MGDGIEEDEEDGEWEAKFVSAVAEALAGEEQGEDAGGLSACRSRS